MSVTLTLPREFGYVLATAVGSFFVHHGYAASQVMTARKRFEVKYPALYADKENCPNDENRRKFNCVQRAAQNSLENQPIFLTLLILAGLKYPVTAAVAGAIYLAGRVLYIRGYSTGDPEKRLQGSIQYAGLLTLLGCVGKFAFDLLSKKF